MKTRLVTGGVVFLLILGFFLFRLTDLQVLRPDRYVEWGMPSGLEHFQSQLQGGIF